MYPEGMVTVSFSDSTSFYDVAVVGAGIIGAACARLLARAGARVVVIDPKPPGSEASLAALGQISPRVEPGRPVGLLPLWRAGQSMFPALIDALADETGERVEYSRAGRINLAFDDGEVARLERALAEQCAEGIPVEMLDAASVHAREPAVSPDVLAGLFFPEHHFVDNGHLTVALASAAERAGATMRIGERATGLLWRGNQVAGVRLENSEIVARWVVIAAGAWSGAIDPACPCPVRPFRGQAIAFHLPPGTLRHMVSVGATMLVHRRSGRLLIGVTNEDVGFESAVTAEAMRLFIDQAMRAIPAVASARFLDAWSGFRPVVPDDLPVIGLDARHPGVIWATGHLGVGIALAPVTAAIVADLVRGQPTEHDLTPFAPTRFESTQPRT
jgi:glycine oxidase